MSQRENYFIQHAALRGKNQPQKMNVEDEYQYEQEEGGFNYQRSQNGYFEENQQIDEQSHEDDGEWNEENNESGNNQDLPYEQKMLNKQLNDAIQAIRSDEDIQQALDTVSQLVLKAKEFLDEDKYNYMFETIVKVLNKDSVEALNENNWEKCSLILNVCDDLTQPHKFGFFVEMRALSLNNQGCMYKRMQDYQMALSCFQKALFLEMQQDSKVYLGYTHLNLSAILNQIGDHKQALSHAKKAVIQLHKDYQEFQKQGADLQALKEQDNYNDVCNNLALAFYNVAVEEEYFNNTEMATLNYENALTFSEENLGKAHHMTNKFRATLNEFIMKMQEEEVYSHRANDNKVNMRPKGQVKKIILPSNKINRPSSAPRKGQQALDQIAQIEKKISTIKDAYNLKGTDFEFKGTQVRIRSANRRPNQINNQNVKVVNSKKGSSPNAEKQAHLQQFSYPQQQNQVQSLQSLQSQPLQTYQKYLTDANGTRGAITASIRFHRTPDQTSNRVFKITQRGGPITANHNNSRGYLDNSSSSIQPFSQSHQNHPLQNNQIPSNSKLRPTSANPRGFKRDRSNENQSYQHNISYTQGNMSFENSYMNIGQSYNNYPSQQTGGEQSHPNQRFPYQYPVLKRNNQNENNYDQFSMNNGKTAQNNSQSSFNQGTNSSFHNNSNIRTANNPNSSYNNQFNGSGKINMQQQQLQNQQRPNTQNFSKQQSPQKFKREVTFSEEDETETKSFSNKKIQPVYNNYFQQNGHPQSQQDYSYNQGNNSTTMSHSYNNYQSYNNNSQNGHRNQLPPPHPQNYPKQQIQKQEQLINRKHYDDFQPEEIYEDGNQITQEEQEVQEVIQEEYEDENNYPRSASAAAQQIQNHIVDNYELEWDDDYNANDDEYEKDGQQEAFVKKNQNEFLNTLKQHKEDKVILDQDLEQKKKEQEELQKRIEQLKEVERQEQQRLAEQEKIKKQHLNEFSQKEQQLNQRIQELIKAENEEKQKYAKLKEQEEKARQDRLLELESFAKLAEEQKQKIEKQKELENSSVLQRSQKLGSEEQIGSERQQSSSSSKRILIKKSSGLHLQTSQWQPDNELSEETLNAQLKANLSYIIIREFSERDINLSETEKPSSSSSSSRMTSSSVSTRRGLLAVVFEQNLQVLIIMYVDNQVRLQSASNIQQYSQLSSSSSIRRKNDQWQHSMDWSDCGGLIEQKTQEELQSLFLNIFENQIESHVRVNLKERFITIANLSQIQIIENLNPIILKVHLKKSTKSSYIEIDNSVSCLIEMQTNSLLQHVNEKDIIEQYSEKKFFCSSGNEKSGIFTVYYNRSKMQIIFEFITLLSDIDYSRNTYYHYVDVSCLSDHYKGGDYLSHPEFNKMIKMIYDLYQKVNKLVRAIDEKEGNESYHPLKIPFSQKWSYLEIVQDTPKHTIEAAFLLIQNSSLSSTTLVIEETLKEKEKTELNQEDYENLIRNVNDQLLQKVDERDIIENYHEAQIVQVKSKGNKTKNGVLGAYYLRQNNMIIIEFIAVRHFDIYDTHTYQHSIDLRLLCSHYNQGSYLTNDEVTKVVTEIIAQYKQVQSIITIEPHYLKVSFDQDWVFEEITENEQTKVYTFFSFSTRPQGKTIVEKKQTIQNLLPQVKKNKKAQPKYSELEEGAALKIQSHFRTQTEYQNTKKQIQNTKKHVFAKTLDIGNVPYFVTLFKELSSQQYYATVQSLSSRKTSQYINFKQLINKNILEILENPDIFFQYYILDAEAKQFVFTDKKNVAASKITNFFFRIKRQKSTKDKAQRAKLPFRVLALRKINFEDKYFLFTIVEKKKNDKRQYSAKIETLNQKGLNRWKSEIKLSSVFAKTITSPSHSVNSQNKLSKKNKKINPFNFFEIDFEKRQIHVKPQAEKQIASQYISKNIKGQYQVLAKIIVKSPLNVEGNFLLSITKATKLKSKGYSAVLESIKQNQQIKLTQKLKSLEGKYLISQIKKNVLQFDQEFNLNIQSNLFELKKERRQIIAQSYIITFIKSRLRFRELFKELFIYQIKKTVQTELHGKKVKYFFTITKKLKDKITTAKVQVVQGKNRINKNLNIPNVFGKFFNFENRLMNDKWDPTNYFEIDPEYGFFEWKKGKKEEVAVKLIISCLRRRQFQQQIKKCQNMKYINKITPHILLTIRSTDNEATPYIIRADWISKTIQLKTKPGILRISQNQYDNLIQSGKDLKEMIKVDTATLNIRIEEDLINFQSESNSVINNNNSEAVSPLKKRQNSGIITQNEIQEDFASISRAYQSNQRQIDDRDLEISPSIEKQSENDNEEDFGRQKIHLESAFDKNTPRSQRSNKNSLHNNSHKNLKEEFIKELQPFQIDKSQKQKQEEANKVEKKQTTQPKETDFDLEDLAYDESFDNTKLGNKSSQKKSQSSLANKQMSSNKKQDEYTLEEFTESIREEEDKIEDNQYYESARGVKNTNQSERKHSQDQEVDESQQKLEFFQNLQKESSQKNGNYLQPLESPTESFREYGLKQGEQNLDEEISITPKKLGVSDLEQKDKKQGGKLLSKMSLTEEDIFNQSEDNKYVSIHEQSKEGVNTSLLIELDTIEIYNIIKKAKDTSYSTVSLTSHFDLQTAKIVFNCPDSQQIKQIEYSINLNKLACGSQISGLTKQQLQEVNREEIANEIQEYIYNNLLVYVVENSEIVVLSEEQLNLIKKIQKKFILKHYRQKFQMNIADEFLAASYSCYIQIGAIKRDIFLLIITESLSHRGSNNKCVKYIFVKLSNVSVRQISRNQQRYLFDNISFDQTNNYFYFNLERFNQIIKQEREVQQPIINKQLEDEQDKTEQERNLQHQKSDSQYSLNQFQQKEIEQNQNEEKPELKQNKEETILISDFPVKIIGKVVKEVSISAVFNQTQNKIIFKANTQESQIKSFTYDLTEQFDISQLQQYAKRILQKCVIDRNQILYIGQLDEDAKKLTAALSREQTIKQIDINIANSNKFGNALFGRKGPKWFIKLFTYNDVNKLDNVDLDHSAFSQQQYEKIQTDYIEISHMNKEKRLKIIKYFGLLINSNIEIVDDQLKLQDKKEFLKTIELQIFQSPVKEQVLA